MEIRIPYTPRSIWAHEIHEELCKHRYAVIVAHRRFGKTVGMVNHMIRDAIGNNKLSPRYAFVGPFQNQMENIVWEPLKYYTSVIDGIKVNNQKKYVEFPTRHPGAAGARIYVIGADKPERHRGTYLDGAVLDEYADMKPEMWSSVVYPQLQDRKGWCYFIGTPKGPNAFYELYERAKLKRDWWRALYDVEHTGIFTPAEIEGFREEMSDVEFAQEFMCDFAKAAVNDLFSLEELDAAFSRELTEKDIALDEPVVLGTDIARYGDDRSVIWKRKGLLAFAKPRIYKQLNTMEMADMVVAAMSAAKDKPDMNFIDVGNMGAGVIDRVKMLGWHNVSEVAFQSKAQDNRRYENIRCEMYFKLKEWIAKGGSLPDENGLREELACMRYKYSRNGRLVLTPKDEIKEKLGRSPDLSDALALTFARPLALKKRRRNFAYLCNTEYSIMESVGEGARLF